LDWTDGVYVGSYPDFSAGPSAATDAGTLIFGSHNSQILYVESLTGQALGSPVPISPSAGRSVRPYFNSKTNRVFVTETDWGGPPDWVPSFAGYISTSEYKELPAAGGVALALLAGALALAARRQLRAKG